jgi:hypothetical protein
MIIRKNRLMFRMERYIMPIQKASGIYQYIIYQPMARTGLDVLFL